MSEAMAKAAGLRVFDRYFGKLARRYLARGFYRRNALRLIIYYEPNRISYTQVFPFLFYGEELKARFGVDIRCIPNTALLSSSVPRSTNADIVLLQVWFDQSPENIERSFAAVRAANSNAQISFIDAFAHADLRMSRHFESEISFYLKKSLLKDHEAFFRPYVGDTNLTEYYSELYGIDDVPVDWGTPRGILPKLRLSPNFFTAPQFLPYFHNENMPSLKNRSLDIQTRFGIKGLPWYQAMRQDALDKTRAIPGLKLSPIERVAYPKYMEEMRASKICFSPHGYGELCWRDVEGVQAGAVLIKPSMDHLNTLPNIYEPEVTYLPVAWDFSDLEEVVQRVLSDQDFRQYLTTNAYNRISDYVRQAQFVDDMAFLFDA